MSRYPVTYYRSDEELLNVISHFLGLVLSIGGLVLLVVYASLHGTVWHIISFSIFGVSMVTLYLASTLYHYAKGKTIRRKLNLFDHSAIYVLIAGTYTPYCLVGLNRTTGWILFGITWGLAISGIIIKLFYREKYSRISTVGYVLMGLIIIKPTQPI
ncbi:MAG: hemolysin III family protein, partial [Bacteroidota bacterium]